MSCAHTNVFQLVALFCLTSVVGSVNWHCIRVDKYIRRLNETQPKARNVMNYHLQIIAYNYFLYRIAQYEISSLNFWKWNVYIAQREVMFSDHLCKQWIFKVQKLAFSKIVLIKLLACADCSFCKRNFLSSKYSTVSCAHAHNFFLLVLRCCLFNYDILICFNQLRFVNNNFD